MSNLSWFDPHDSGEKHIKKMESNFSELRSAIKKNKVYVIFYTLFILYGGFIAGKAVNIPPDATKESVSSYIVPVPPATDRETITKQFEEKYMSSWNGSCPNLVSYVKKELHDPSSFEHKETRYAYDVQSNCMLLVMKYRAKNAMGALVLEAVDAKVSLDGEVLSVTPAQ